MAEKKVNLRMNAVYNGHNVKPNGSVNVSVKTKYSQLTKAIQFIQVLNNDIKLGVRIEDEVLKIGTFRLKDIKVDHDGECVVNFNSQVDFVEIDNLTDMVNDGKEFELLAKAEIELEDEEE